MAIQTSTLTVVGKVGNLVGRKGLDGKQVITIYQPNVSDAKTAAQVEQRAKVALAAKVAGMLGVVGKQVNVANGYAASRRGKLIRDILARITDGTGYSTPTLISSLPLVKSPGTAITYTEKNFTFTMPTTQASGSVAFSFHGETTGNDTLVRYCTALLLYNKTKNLWQSLSQVMTDSGSIRIYISSDWKDNEIVAYAYVLGVVLGANGLQPEVFMGDLEGDNTHYRLPVDSENVIYGALRYAQIESSIQTHTLSAN